MDNSLKFHGTIVDRVNRIVVGRTRYKTTWGEAQRCAERIAKRKGIYNSERYRIIVN